MKYKKTIFLLSILALFISFMIGVSYAYFSVQVVGNDTTSSNLATTGTLKITFNGTNQISVGDIEPGEEESTIFTVKNTGTVILNSYEIYFSNVINELVVKEEMVYTIGCVSSDANPCDGKTQTVIPINSTSILIQGSIDPGTTHTYTLTIKLLEMGYLQDYNQGKEVSFKVTINEESDYSTMVEPTYVGSPTFSTVGYFWDYKEDITSITFENRIDIPVGAIASWDVSSNVDGSIMAYIIDDGLGTSTYELYIQGNDYILANPNSSYLFFDFVSLVQINNLNLLKTHFVTNMFEMFYNCINLTTLDLTTFDTSNVTDMSWMFGLCDSLTSLNLSSFDTSNVTTMYSMFYYCENLTSLDIDFFDTSSVTEMYYMFYYCASLTTLDVSSFNTTIVEEMSFMFSGCNSLISLNLSSFDTSSVTSMSSMFSDCINLNTIDLSSFDTINVLYMSSMFTNCSSLINLDLSTFDTSKVLNMFNLFAGCSDLTDIDMRNMVFTTVVNYSTMFNGITNGINIVVKDSAAQTWINARLTDVSKTGNVTIYVP